MNNENAALLIYGSLFGLDGIEEPQIKIMCSALFPVDFMSVKDNQAAYRIKNIARVYEHLGDSILNEHFRLVAMMKSFKDELLVSSQILLPTVHHFSSYMTTNDMHSVIVRAATENIPVLDVEETVGFSSSNFFEVAVAIHHIHQNKLDTRQTHGSLTNVYAGYVDDTWDGIRRHCQHMHEQSRATRLRKKNRRK
jgi:hypothetical protein